MSAWKDLINQGVKLEEEIALCPNNKMFDYYTFDNESGGLVGLNSNQVKKQLCAWISIHDKLPPDDVEVLVSWPTNFDGRHELDLCRLLRGFNSYTFIDKYGDPNELVTHWMELPERLRAAND